MMRFLSLLGLLAVRSRQPRSGRFLLGHSKSATYNLIGGGSVTASYDPNAPCRICGFPVIEASIGGTDVCPWCDMGSLRPEQLPPMRVSTAQSTLP